MKARKQALLLLIINLFHLAISNISQTKDAYFAAGCYWSIELAFQRVPGVLKTSVGFAGGKAKNPSYQRVSSGRTGHAETVHVQYDEEIVTYKELLRVFFSLHDPTTLNRQGGDVGTQYRSAIFPVNSHQRNEASEYIKSLDDNMLYGSKVVTTIESPFTYTKAHSEHQQYLEKLGQSSAKGSLNPIQCYGNRGPIKNLKKSVHSIFLKSKVRSIAEQEDL
eukprot:g598.t1